MSTYLGGTGQPISGLTNANVQAQFADVQIAHHILGLVRLRLLGLLSSNGLSGGLCATEKTERLVWVTSGHGTRCSSVVFVADGVPDREFGGGRRPTGDGGHQHDRHSERTHTVRHTTQSLVGRRPARNGAKSPTTPGNMGTKRCASAGRMRWTWRLRRGCPNFPDVRRFFRERAQKRNTYRHYCSLKRVSDRKKFEFSGRRF